MYLLAMYRMKKKKEREKEKKKVVVIPMSHVWVRAEGLKEKFSFIVEHTHPSIQCHLKEKKKRNKGYRLGDLSLYVSSVTTSSSTTFI
jgi:hypothetical protein